MPVATLPAHFVLVLQERTSIVYFFDVSKGQRVDGVTYTIDSMAASEESCPIREGNAFAG
jgi:hypothetical protein